MTTNATTRSAVDRSRPDGPAEHAVRTEELWKIYPQEPRPVEAVRGVDLAVDPGEFVAMAGPSGSGKTTVLNMLGGLTRPTRGKVWVDGLELSALPDRRLARVRQNHIGFVFQSYNLLPMLTALENAEFTLLLQGVPARERRERVLRLFHEIGLEGMEHRRPLKLSGGQQQRVAVARAVLGEPALVLADEPTANLDSATAEALLDVMQQLNREKGTTFVFSTHDPRVMKRAGRLIRLVDGRIAEDVVKGEVPNRATLEAMKELKEGKGQRFGSVEEFSDLDI